MSQNMSTGPDESITIKEGFLVKRGHMRHNWKTRWFKLSDTSLRYYKSKGDKVPQGRIPLVRAKLSMYHCVNKHDKDREFVMQISTKDGVVYPIQAPSSEELKIWMQYIHDIIEHLELENESNYMPHLPESMDTRDLSTAEILGTYIDAYGDINNESRCVNGKDRDDGFSGIGLRVWLEHSQGLGGAKAEALAIELLDKEVICMIDGGDDSSTFSESRYYGITGEEKSLKKVVEEYQSQNGSIKSTQSDIDAEWLPPEVLNASATPSAVLPANLPPGEIVKLGILFKRGHIVPNWKARCFVLQRYPATLSYFDPSKKSPKVLNCLSLRGASVQAVNDTIVAAASKFRDESHLFCVETAQGIIYYIMASSYLERHEWVENIKILCRKIVGTNKTAVPSDRD